MDAKFSAGDIVEVRWNQQNVGDVWRRAIVCGAKPGKVHVKYADSEHIVEPQHVRTLLAAAGRA